MKKMGLRKSEASLRSEVLAYAARHYGTAPEYLWRALPGYAALRHQDNRKWYGIVMNVTTDKLGLPGREPVDILEVKCDPILSGSFCLNPGVLPAYHMKQGNWITVLLDGTVDPETVFALLDMSYRLTGPRAAPCPRRGGRPGSSRPIPAVLIWRRLSPRIRRSCGTSATTLQRAIPSTFI